MPVLPHDITDLHLAPVLLALEERIQEMGKLTFDELRRYIALVANRPDWNRELREGGILGSVNHLIDTHDWELTWTDRGIEVRHSHREVTLGVPRTFVDYVDGKHRVEQDA